MNTDKIKSRYRSLTTWEGGQRLFNFAYCVGAAIVIWGTLFKILNLPGGNTLLCIGMGTEVLMFIITAFDRPPKEYRWEDVFPQLDDNKAGEATPAVPRDITRNHVAPAQDHSLRANGAQPVVAVHGESTADMTAVTREYVEQMTAISAQLAQLQETTRNLNEVSAILLQNYQAIADSSSALAESSRDYISRLGDINRNLGGLSAICEIQLKDVSAQSAHYREETEKMTRNMQHINRVYENMLHAMTVNLPRPMAGVPDNSDHRI